MMPRGKLFSREEQFWMHFNCRYKWRCWWKKVMNTWSHVYSHDAWKSRIWTSGLKFSGLHRYYITCAIQPLSTRLIKPNFCSAIKTTRITHFKLRFNPQFKCMIFTYQHDIYIYIYIELYSLSMSLWSTHITTWPDSSTDRALHWQRRVRIPFRPEIFEAILVTARISSVKKI